MPVASRSLLRFLRLDESDDIAAVLRRAVKVSRGRYTDELWEEQCALWSSFWHDCFFSASSRVGSEDTRVFSGGKVAVEAVKEWAPTILLIKSLERSYTGHRRYPAGLVLDVLSAIDLCACELRSEVLEQTCAACLELLHSSATVGKFNSAAIAEIIDELKRGMKRGHRGRRSESGSSIERTLESLRDESLAAASTSNQTDIPDETRPLLAEAGEAESPAVDDPHRIAIRSSDVPPDFRLYGLLDELKSRDEDDRVAVVREIVSLVHRPQILMEVDAKQASAAMNVLGTALRSRLGADAAEIELRAAASLLPLVASTTSELADQAIGLLLELMARNPVLARNFRQLSQGTRRFGGSGSPLDADSAKVGAAGGMAQLTHLLTEVVAFRPDIDDAAIASTLCREISGLAKSMNVRVACPASVHANEQCGLPSLPSFTVSRKSFVFNHFAPSTRPVPSHTLGARAQLSGPLCLVDLAGSKIN